MKEIPPPKLYKYQSCNENALNNLRGRSIWFSKPESFNDPFDCNINFQLVDITEENLELLFNSLRKDESDKEEFDRNFHSDGRVTKSFKNMVIEFSRKAPSKLVNRFASLGVACFAEKNDDILMWSHYASSHQGFCLEFDTTKFPFMRTDKPGKDIALNNLPSLSQDLLSVKSSHWSYEKEWRLFSKRGNAELDYEKTALTGVYLSCKIAEENKEIIKSILGNSIPVYEMQRSTTEFKVIAKEIR